jgi:hypothetical protein
MLRDWLLVNEGRPQIHGTQIAGSQPVGRRRPGWTIRETESLAWKRRATQSEIRHVVPAARSARNGRRDG